MLKKFIAKVVDRQDLSEAEASQAMDQIMGGQAPSTQIASLLTGLRMKGETEPEITGFARAMRGKAIAIRPGDGECVVDTCGTGGDGIGTFNISTAVAFVAAGGGLTVAKHGNRSVSSRSGSADVLEALGVNIGLAPEKVAMALQELKLAFLFAPSFHPAMKYAAAPRREIGIRTVFNLLGPLSNPAGASAQLIGVYDGALTETMARVLGELGVKRAFVVHGLDGLDEITLTTGTKVSRLEGGKVDTFHIAPEDLGLARCRPEDLGGGTARENALRLREVLSGRKGPLRDATLLNAAAVITAAGAAADFREGIGAAARSIDDGSALEALDRLVRVSRGEP